MRVVLILQLLSAAAPAAAECFTARDLEGGLVVSYGDKGPMTFTRGADGTLHVDDHMADPSMRLRLQHGVYVDREEELGLGDEPVPGTRAYYEFQVPAAALPPPAPGVTWTGPQIVNWMDGSMLSEIATWRFEAGDPLTLSDCTYETLKAHVHYDMGEGRWREFEYLYLPALGVPIVTMFQNDGGDVEPSWPLWLARKDW